MSVFDRMGFNNHRKYIWHPGHAERQYEHASKGMRFPQKRVDFPFNSSMLILTLHIKIGAGFDSDI